jgi:hypothetical protein
MLCSHEDGLARDTVHVDASTGFEVVEVNEAMFCREIDDTVLFRNLRNNWEVICSPRWEVNINGLLGEWRIGSGMIDFDNVQLK